MHNIRTKSSSALLSLILLGFVIIYPDYKCVSAADPKCTLEVETVNVAVPLNPPSEYCGHSSVTVENVVRGYCSNNGHTCINYHYRHTETLLRQFCIPLHTTNIVGTKTVTGNGCSKTVTYTFANVTECECEYIGTASLVTLS